MVETSTLKVTKEEQLVLNDWPADGTAIQIPAQLGCWKDTLRRTFAQAVLPLIGVENVVPEELENVAVKAVGAGFDGGVHDPALKVPEFSGGVLGNEIELLNGVGGRSEAEAILRNLVVVDAVEQEIVSLLAVSVDVGTTSAFRRVGAELQTGRV